MAKKQRRPTDSTIRNVQAANKKIAALTKRVAALEKKLRSQAGVLLGPVLE